MKGIILDFGGVVADTVLQHTESWNQVFAEIKDTINSNIQINKDDYLEYFMNQPKQERLKMFLEVQGINLPAGSKEDAEDLITLHSLEKRNSQLFSQLMNNKPLHFFSSAIQKIEFWKSKGLKIAAVSCDENFKHAVINAGQEKLFDVLIQYKSSRNMGLKEKPEADIYIKAAKKLDLSPESCVLFDNTVAGVQAGCKANIGLVVGVNSDDIAKQLSEQGADIVINDLEEIDLINDPDIALWFTQPTPKYAPQYVKISESVFGKIPVLFLDYDGTLTPIVKHPEEALISQEMKNVLRKCAGRFTVAVVSGRDMDNLKSKVQLDNLIYAGSHGFRISGPDGLYMEHEKTQEIIPVLDNMEKKLKQVFANDSHGVQVERKRYAIAVHYRNAPKEDTERIKQKVSEIAGGVKGLKTGEGKKIIEIKPDIEWHKGKAVLWIIDKLGFKDSEKYIPVYIGDDTTDEDAYKAIQEFGISIQVGPGANPSHADYKLKNVYQVRIFLDELAKYLV